MKEIVIKLSVNKIINMLHDRLQDDFDKNFIPKNSKERIKKIVLKNVGVIARCGKESVMEVIKEGYNDALDKDIGKFYGEIQDAQDRVEDEKRAKEIDEKDFGTYLRLKRKYEK